MAENNSRTQHVLGRLYRIVEAGERGFATAAANASNRGLKLLFKSFAQQRANFKAEIWAEMQRLGGEIQPRKSLMAIVHRGRVAIFSAMVIENAGRDRVVAKEALVGERYAVQTYQRALEENLPAETRELVNRQYEAVRRVQEQVQLLLGGEGRRMVVRVYNSEPEADRAVRSLGQSGIQPVEKVSIGESVERYHGRGTTVPETIVSGMVGGVVWGSLIGVLAGIGVSPGAVPGLLGIDSELALRILVALATIVLAAFVGGLIGLVIGAGISEDDSYIYQHSVREGRYLVRAVVEPARAPEVERAMDQASAQPGEPAVPVSA